MRKHINSSEYTSHLGLLFERGMKPRLRVTLYSAAYLNLFVNKCFYFFHKENQMRKHKSSSEFTSRLGYVF